MASRRLQLLLKRSAGDTSPQTHLAIPLVVASASGANGDGYGALLAFDRDGQPLGRFSTDDRIADPRGVAVDTEEVLLFSTAEPITCWHSITLASSFLVSGIGSTGDGDDRVLVFAPGERHAASPLVTDPALSPLDLLVAPNGNLVVSSEQPFGAPDAATTVREYDASDGHLVRVFSPGSAAAFHKLRGLRFGPDGMLYCAAQDEVIAFDFGTGECLVAAVRWPRLNGQALAFFP